MARSNKNVVMHKASGIIGDLLLFRQRYGKTFMGKIPERSGVLSDKQKAVREKFVKAALYAKKALADPEISVLYDLRAGGGITAFNLALADYFKAPFFGEAITTGYDGTPGSKIDLAVTDDTKVTSVEVTITAVDGSLVEKGIAVQQEDGPQWIYTATVANAVVAGSKISVVAKDIPGNKAFMEITLS